MGNPFLQELEKAKPSSKRENPFLQELSTPKKEKDSGLEDFMEGVAVSGMNTWYGLKDLGGKIGLGGGMDDEDRARLEDWKRDAAESGWGKAGEITGEIGQMVVGGGVGGGILKGLSKASKLGKLARVAGTLDKTSTLGGRFFKKALPGAVHSAVRLDESGKGDLGDRATNAGISVLGDAVLGAAAPVLRPLGKAGRALIRGVEKTKAGEEALRLGGRPTAAQVAKSDFVRGLESLAEQYLPDQAPKIRAIKKAGITDYSKDIIDSIRKEIPGADKIAMGGKEGVGQLSREIEKGYEKAWSKFKPQEFDTDALKTISKRVEEAPGKFADMAPLNRVKNAIDSLGEHPTKEELLNVSKVIGVARGDAVGDAALSRELNDINKMFRKGLPESVRKEVEKIDNVYPAYKVLERAGAAGAELGEEAVNPKTLRRATNALSSDKRVVRGDTPLENYLDIGEKVYGSAPPITPGAIGFKSGLMKLGDVSGDTWQDSLINQILLGNTVPQRYLLAPTYNALERGGTATADALRRMGLGGATNIYNYGAALNPFND